MKRPAHMTLVDADRYSALVTRCTEQRERAEKAEARIEALDAKMQECSLTWQTEVAALEARIEALERVRRATEVINTTTHEASKGVYLGKPCAHGNLPVYPTHARWCDECWQELEDALMAALRGGEDR